jgi:pimeloyl-ACP methyl ester carboxylesterase
MSRLDLPQGSRPPVRWSLPLALLVTAACSGAPISPTRPYEYLGFVEGGAGRLRVSDGGVGEPAVVFVHGLGSDLEAWRVQLERLRVRRRVVAFDQRGHGGSDRARDGVYTIEALTGDLQRVVEALGLRRFVLVGHSMAGTVLTSYAGAHPEQVASLVYVDAVGDFQAIARPHLEEAMRGDRAFTTDPAARHRIYGEMLGPLARPATRAAVLASVDRLDPPAFAALRQGLFEFKVGERLGGYQGPITAIEAAGTARPIMASAVLRGARRVELPGVSHWLMLDDPAAFDRALDEALAAR